MSATDRASRDLRVFIVADDLTGAADAAASFRSARRRVRVTFPDAEPWDPRQESAVVQVHDTESRSARGEDAGRRVGRAARALRGVPQPFRVFKKIDSTLRGQIGAEIDAALRALGHDVAVVAPAFPANRRAVRDGILFIDGIPLTQTSMARDPRTPVGSDRVATIIRATSALPCREIGLEAVRSPHGLAQAVAGARFSALICDAETDEDLDAIAAAVDEVLQVLPCGSAGLARALAARWNGSTAADGGAEGARVLDRGAPVLVVVGSANPAVHEQLAALGRRLGVRPVRLDAARLADPRTRPQEVERGRAEIVGSPAQLRVLTLSHDHVGAPGSAPVRLEADLAAIAAQWRAAHPGDAGLICTGGDTALAVCRALGARAIWPEGEVAPGVPWSAVEHPGHWTVLVSKAGGFGGPEVLADAVAFLRGERQPQQGVNA